MSDAVGPAIQAGFYGKVPARGDFIRSGLPRDFTDHWDDWLQTVMAGSRELMGEDWLPAYLEAPVWRFSLTPGLCGGYAVLGLMLPSVDKAGRYFPLTFAALLPNGAAIDDAWLHRCEEIGFATLERDMPPEQMAALLTMPSLADAATMEGSAWWTDGSPRVAPVRFTLPGMPDRATYAMMLGASAEQSEVDASGGTLWNSTP